MQGVRRALQSPDMTSILVQGATIAAIALEPDTVERPPGWLGLVDSFIDVDIAETTVLLHFIGAFTTDELQRARVRRELANRRQPVPAHVRMLPEAAITSTWVMERELDDGFNILLGIEWPDGSQTSGVVYIDHVMGTIVKDAFFVGQATTDLVTRFAEISAEQGHGEVVPVPIDPADALVRIRRGLRNLDTKHPDWSGDTWPACRSLLEYLLRTLPDGGQDYPNHAASDSVLEELADAFLASEEASGLADDAGVRGAALALLGFANRRFDDPLWWSVTTVKFALTEDLPRDPDLGDDVLDAIPDVASPLVRYSHRVRGISAETMHRTVALVNPALARYAILRMQH